MMRTINWKAKQEYARTLTMDQLAFAVRDCGECFKAWNRDPSCDYDGNAAYYADEASVYRDEMLRREPKKGGRK